MLEVTWETGGQNDVERAVADDLVGDADVAALGVPRPRSSVAELHHRFVPQTDAPLPDAAMLAGDRIGVRLGVSHAARSPTRQCSSKRAPPHLRREPFAVRFPPPPVRGVRKPATEAFSS